MVAAECLTLTSAGLYCSAGDFYIDPLRAVPRALITHGHSDHARPGHDKVLATQETLAIMAIRCGADFAGATQAIAYGEGLRLGEVTVSFHPAGHVLGSAQILLCHRGGRIVVSGDYKRQADPTCAAFEPVPCDCFITEATFGLPVFRHADPAGEIGKLLASLQLFPERCHLVGAYALGKAQRILALLRAAGYDRPIFLHGSLGKVTDYYVSTGLALGELRPLVLADVAKLPGEIVLCPPMALTDLALRGDTEPRKIFASGWMRVRAGAPARHRAAAGDFRSCGLGRALPHCPRYWLCRASRDAWRERCAGALGAKPRNLGRASPSHGLWRRRDGEWGRGLRMNRFAALLDRLAFEPSRNAKIRLIADYFHTTPDPDRGFALAALTDALSFRYAKPKLIKTLIADRVDPHLFGLSYDYVGDLSETVALLWPAAESSEAHPSSLSLTDVVYSLTQAGSIEQPCLLARFLDGLDETGRWALLKLITGALRIGVSARLAKQAVAEFGTRPANEIEDIWHALAPPYLELFAWLEGRAGKPETRDPAPFRSAMLAHALEASDLALLPLEEFRAEWKWDGIRVQACVGETGEGRKIVRLFSRTGEDISTAFPDLVSELMQEPARSFALDGELLIVRDGLTQAFSILQQRLNRKLVSAKLLAAYPAHIRVYDMLALDGEDLRPLPFVERRRRLESFIAGAKSRQLDLSPLLAARSWEELAAARRDPACIDAEAIEGIMLKRADFALFVGPAERLLVQMEARSRDDRCRADVCPTRPWQKIVSLLGLYVWSLAQPRGRGSPCPCRQGLFRFHR